MLSLAQNMTIEATYYESNVQVNWFGGVTNCLHPWEVDKVTR